MLITREYAVSGRKRSSSTSSEEPLVKKSVADPSKGARTQQEYTVSGAGKIQRFCLENFSVAILSPSPTEEP